MADERVFYTHPMARGRTVRWMLEEIGVPYRTELLEYDASMKAPAYLAIDPMGKVPAIRHGDTVVTEGAAICAYLADAFPAVGLAPPPGRERMAGYGIFDNVINMLEIAVSGGEYSAGNRFTAADLYLGSQIGFGMIDKRPALEQYWARIGARPAAIRAREIDDALMPKP